MNRLLEHWFPFGALMAAVVALSPVKGAELAVATGNDADVTEDGLARVDLRVVRDAWVRPGVDLDAYHGIYLMPTGISYRAVEAVSRGQRTGDLVETFPVDDDTRLRMRAYFRSAFGEAMQDSDEFTVTDSVGRDVLVVQGFLVDVVSHVPPDDRSTTSSTVQNYPWEAMIVLELRDSMSNTILARTIDRERTRGTSVSGVDWTLTQRVLDAWSTLLRRRLDELGEASRR